MNRPRRLVLLATSLSLSATSLVAFGEGTAHAGSNTTYVAGSPVLATVENGPWTLSQGDATVGAPYDQSLPTYTPGGTPTQSGGYPNLAVYPASSAPPGPPYATGEVGTPGPVDGYCSSGGAAPETGSQVEEPANTKLPMSPYYFPFVMNTPGGSQGDLTGFFDYRPKDTEEEVVVATSTNGGLNWNYVSNALDQNPQNYCPMGDSNDNGLGHAFVMTVGGNTYMYLLQRPAGDNLGVGLLVYPVDPSASNPLSGLPAVQSVGTDPDTFASAAVSLPTTGGTGATIDVSTLGSGVEVVGPGQFEDMNAASPSGSVITCTGTGSATLTGCTSANPSGLSVDAGDELLQVLGDVSSAVTIPAGPNNTSETGGVSVGLNTVQSAITSANVSGRFYVDGDTIYCVNISSSNEILENCTTTASGGVPVAVGAPLTGDPIVPPETGQPAGVPQTNGLVAPDGIVGVIPSNISYPGAPSGSTVIIYGEKILNYFIEGTVATAVTLPASTITMTPSTSTAEPLSSGANTIYLGTSGGIQTVSCTGYASDSFTGCSGGSGSVAAGNDVGGPGAAIAPYSVLNTIGEGKNKAASLFKNNEDLTELRAAYTTDGVNFTDLGPISGTSGGSTPYSDINNPTAQAYPSTQDLAQGATDTPELRFVGTRGTIIENPDGSIGMFLSGSWESDGDSDAFNQIFYTSSTNGVDWTEPTVVESTDYTFSARQQQDAALADGDDDALGISAYFAGRAYGPTVVQNPDGTLTMVFAGYSTPKPIPLDGAVLGDGQGGAPTWTVSADDPALYRNILTVTLTPNSPVGTPESPYVIFLPLLAGFLGIVAYVYTGRRRRLRTSP